MTTARALEFPSFTTDLSHDAYLKVDAVSNSLLQRVGQSPAHAFEWLKNPPEPTPAMLFGTMAHAAILQPDVFKRNYAVMPKFDGRTNAGKAAKDEWLAANDGKKPLPEDQFSQILGMTETVYDHPKARNLLGSGEVEVSYFTKDHASGLNCKGRVDCVSGPTLIDVKTTDDASAGQFMRSILNFGYHQQAAFYLDLVGATTFGQFDQFIIIAVEKRPPYAVAVYELDANAIARGREIYRRNLDRWAECLATKTFPAYSQDVQSISIPHWGFHE